MQGAILIYGNKQENRNTEVDNLLMKNLGFQSLNHPDLRILEKDGKKSISIKQVKDAVKFLNQRPFSGKHKAVVCYNAELLTTQAQNSLLKTLEELPKYASIFLSTPTTNDILPTILSRCQRINIRNKDKTLTTYNNDLKKLINLNKGELLDWAIEESKEDRELIIADLEELVDFLSSEMRKEPSKQHSNKIKIVNKVKEDLKNTNINPKLALEYMAVNFQ